MIVGLLLCVLSIVPPVPGRVVQRFVAPACERCPGHRGITIESATGDSVVAVVSGVVVFAGWVGGSLYVVQEIRPGVKITYGKMHKISPSLVDVNSDVASTHVPLPTGAELGVAGPSTYLGVRVRGHYVEPMRYLGMAGARLRGAGGLIVGGRGQPR